MAGRRVLVVERENEATVGLAAAVGSLGFETTAVPSLHEASNKIAADRYDVMIVDINVGGDALPALLEQTMRASLLPIIVVADRGTSEETFEALRKQNVRVLAKPAIENSLRCALHAPLASLVASCTQGEVTNKIDHMQQVIEEQATILARLSGEIATLTARLSARFSDRQSTHIGDDQAFDAGSQTEKTAVVANDHDTGNSTDMRALASLSSRELIVATLIQAGMTTEEIAERLDISVDTAKTHRRNIRRKLDITGGAKGALAARLRALHEKTNSHGPTASTAQVQPRIPPYLIVRDGDHKKYHLNRRFLTGRRREDRRPQGNDYKQTSIDPG